MKKSELLELIKDIEEDSDINETILGIEDFAKSSNKDITLEDFKDLLANNKEIKGYYTSNLDSARSKAVEHYKNNKGKEAIELAVQEALKNASNEGLTEEQKQVKELKKQLEDMQKQQKLNEVRNSYNKVFNEKKLDTRLLDLLNLDRENEAIDKDISILEEVINSSVSNKVDETFKNSHTQPSGSEKPQDALDDVSKAFYAINPDLKH